jgi:hypothetical protein
VHGHAVGGFVRIIGEILAGLDIVLVVIGPVESHLLAVVGDGVAFFLGVTAPGDKVALLPVAAEEGVEVVVDVGFQRFASAAALGPGLCFQIFLADVGVAIGFDQVAIGVKGVIAQGFQHLFPRRFQGLCCLRLFSQCATLQFLRDGTGQVCGDEALNRRPLVIHDAVDAEIQIGAVALEKLAEEGLACGPVFIHRIVSTATVLGQRTVSTSRLSTGFVRWTVR